MKTFSIIALSAIALTACTSEPKPLNPYAFGRPVIAQAYDSYNAVEWVEEGTSISAVHKALLAGMKHADFETTLDNHDDGYVRGKSRVIPGAEFNAFFLQEDADIRVLMSVTGETTDIIDHANARELTIGMLEDVRTGFDAAFKSK